MSTTTSAQPAQLTRNERLDRLPFNKAHRKLLVASGIGWAFDAMDVGLVSFVVAAIAADPAADHQPHTKRETFRQTLESMLNVLYRQGVQPVLMSLPPIDPRRYLNFICRNGLDRSAILRWLGDEDMIYRHQEMYSDAVTQLAYAEDLPLIPVREEFLNDHKLMRLIAADGIHLTMPGYERLFDTLADWLRVRV